MKPKFILGVFAFCLFVTACIDREKSNKEVLEITEKSFDELVERTENLTFSFNRDIAIAAKHSVWDTTQYIQFTPAIKGRFQWKSANELVFSPKKTLPPSTDFTGTLADALIDLAIEKGKKLKLPKEKTFDFHTPYLALDGAKAFWRQSSTNKNEPAIGGSLQFNYKVQPEDVLKRLSIKVNDKAIKYDMLTLNASEAIRIEVRGMDIEETTTISYAIDKGLSPINSSWTSKEVFSMNATLAAPTDVSIAGVEANHDGASGKVQVTTSQQLRTADLKKMVSLNPSIPFEVEHTTNGFSISSESFDASKSYELTISKNLTGAFKGTLGKDYSTAVSFGKLEPKISFVHDKSTYLTDKGYRNIALQIINVPKVRVKIHKVFENNILSLMRSGKEWRYDSHYDEVDKYWEYYDYQVYKTDDHAQTIHEETIKTDQLEKVGKIRLLNLDFKDKLTKFEGAYVIEVEDADRHYIYDSHLVSYSDIGLMVRKSEEQIHVFASSILTAKPIANATISFISRTNQKVHTAQTNSEGVAVLEDLKKKTGDFNIAMITAEHKNNFNYMVFKDTEVSTSRFEVGGRYNNPSGYEAFVYGERNLYRPGETVHVSTIVRTEDWDTPDPMPVKFKLLMPNGKEYKTIRKTLNSQGAAEAAFVMPHSVVTGTYVVEAYTGDDVLLNSYSVSIEEFMPDRIKIDVDADKEEVKPDEAITFSGTATNFFGPPAAGRNYEVEMTLNRKGFSPDEFSDYVFYVENTKSFDSKKREGKTGDDGGYDEKFDIPDEYTDMGILQGQFFTTVFDETGRPVNRIQPFEVLTQDAFYGIGDFGYYVSTRQPLQIPLVAVDKEGKALNNKNAHVNIIRYEWRTVMESTSNGRYRYRSQKEEIVEVDRDIKISGKDQLLAYTPSRSGRFEVRVSRPGSDAYVKRNFYAYRWGDTQSTSFEVDQEGQVDIVLDKDSYQVGETAKVLLKCPFEGRLLVTLERDKVIRYMDFETDKKAREFSFEVPANYVPNIYISATLLRPMNDLGVPLTIAHGYKALMVDNAKNTLPLKITAVEKSRSKTKQTIRVESEPNTELTLAVVDEGILQIKNYQSPAPYDFFYQKQALEVEGYDIYPYLFPELVESNPLTGGDAGYGLGKRVNQMPNERIKLTRFWSGVTATGNDGVLEYDIDIPQYSGDLRIMAVAYKDHQFASESTNMKVADPVVISTGLPRFLSPDDEIEVPVTITNTTDNPTDAKVSITTTGPLKIVGDQNDNPSLKANSEGRSTFKIAAQPNVGVGKVTVAVKAMGETFTEEIELGVRPASTLVKQSGAGSVKGGNSETLDLANKFVPESIDGKLVVSRSPLTEFSRSLDYLIGYPHGCVEQTTSKAFPQLYVQDLMKSLDQPARTVTAQNSNNPNYNVNEAIKKLVTMQQNSGGFSYWRGGSTISWWGSVFATHFLLEAKKAGFEVPETTLKPAFKYLKQRLRKKETYVHHYYNAANGREKIEKARREIPYALYVLALANQPDVSTMNYYKANMNLLTLDAKYLLAASYGIAGDRARSEQLIPKFASFKEYQPVQEFGSSFSSPLRDKALALNVLLESNPNHPDIGTMAKHLANDFRKKRWLNTQESVFTLLAFGKIAKRNNDSNATGTITANGKTIGEVTDKDVSLNWADIQADKVDLKVNGKGELYYFWDMEGLTKDGSYPEEDSFLKVRRTFFDRNGKKITDNKFEQNDLVVVQLTLQALQDDNVENIVIADILPAGFEVENPRISDIPELSWIKNATTPQHKDFRDDRVHLYTYATNKPKDYYYVVRAVTPGEFKIGPAAADAMYAGEYHSYHGGGEIQVVQK